MNHTSQHSRTIKSALARLCAVCVFIAGAMILNRPATAQDKPAPDDEGPQVLTRGPVHEAFAETVTFDPQPGIVVPKTPPQAVEELPPDQRPEGDNVTWIPGYWAWDDERQDFLWISGIWRDMPPGRQWISGYWREADGGYQWVSGYWAGADQNQVEALPEAPPATLEAGPNVPAPSPDQTWVPGLWTWRQSRYVWRPGFWTVPQPGWVWVPAYYAWTPGGFVLAGGYWDYPVPVRGVLFAPVFFTAGYYAAPGYFYTPGTVINLAVFSNHLFLRPRFCHYYFGDYYAASYAGMGFYPWFSLSIRTGYDPIFAYQRWQHRNDNNWQRRLEASYRNRQEHPDARPAHTMTAEMARAGMAGASLDKTNAVAVSLDQASRLKDMPKMRPIDKPERDKLAEHGKEIQQYRAQRQDLEAKALGRDSQPAKVKLPTSPFVTRSPGQAAIDQGLPSKKGVPRSGTAGQPGEIPRGGRSRAASSQAGSGLPSTGSVPGVSGAGEQQKGRGPIDRSTGRNRINTSPPLTQQPGPQVQNPSGANTQPGATQQQQQQMRRQQRDAQVQPQQQQPNVGRPGGSSWPAQQYQGGDRRMAPSQRQFNAGPQGPQMRKGPPRPQGDSQDKKKDRDSR